MKYFLCATLTVAGLAWSACSDDAGPAATTTDTPSDVASDASEGDGSSASSDTLLADVTPAPDATDTPDTGDNDLPAPDLPPDTPAADVADVAEETFVLPEGLVGQAPASSDTSLPSFAGVIDHTGAAVTPADLVGQWTAIWFYPLASTTG